MLAVTSTFFTTNQNTCGEFNGGDSGLVNIIKKLGGPLEPQMTFDLQFENLELKTILATYIKYIRTRYEL